MLQSAGTTANPAGRFSIVLTNVTGSRREPGTIQSKLLVEASRDRLPELLPIKWARMVASPFGFFRGAVPLMAADLASLPTTGITVQICGDAHVRNLGAFASPTGALVFDINDFDETMPGPWEWDVKRLATSLVLSGREAGQSDGACKEAVESFAAEYRKSVNHCSELTVLELARYTVHRHMEAGPLPELHREGRACNTAAHSREAHPEPRWRAAIQGSKAAADGGFRQNSPRRADRARGLSRHPFAGPAPLS